MLDCLPAGNALGSLARSNFNNLSFRATGKMAKDEIHRYVSAIRAQGSLVSGDMTERQQLADELHACRKQIQALKNALTHTKKRDRNRVAMVLHDEVGQLLALIKVKLTICKVRTENIETQAALESMSKLLNQVIQTTRNLTAEFGSAQLDDTEFVTAMQNTARLLQQTYGAQIRIDNQQPPLSLPPEHPYTAVTHRSRTAFQ